MANQWIEKFKWRVGKWFWTPPGELPVADKKDAAWIIPGGKPVKNKTRRFSKAQKGTPPAGTKAIEEFHHRGSYSNREPHGPHATKAVMGFRGKGAKVERRSNRSRLRRAQQA